jgi:AraC-like DNA-binding protein
MGEVSVRFHRPTPALQDAIFFYYVVRIGSEPVEDLLHPEGAHVRLLLSGDWRITFADGRTGSATGPAAVLTGALSRSAMVRGSPGGVMVSVGLLPAGWALLSDLRAVDYLDSLHPFSDIVGQDAGELLATLAPDRDDDAYIRALDAWFMRRREERPVDPLVVAAHNGLEDEEIASVAEWARSLGCSVRQLERLARHYIGLPPKRLLRRQRFLRSSASLREEPLGGWGRAIDDRYADQPQFAREFKYFMGMSPRAYFALKSPLMTAGAEARKAAPVALGLERDAAE